MLNQQTLEKLHALRLHGMAEGFRRSLILTSPPGRERSDVLALFRTAAFMRPAPRGVRPRIANPCFASAMRLHIFSALIFR